jgi:hypothetical protein
MIKNGWYAILEQEQVPHLLVRKADKIYKVSHLGQLFDDLSSFHYGNNHCKGKVLKELVANEYANIGREYIAIYLSSCPECSKHKSKLEQNSNINDESLENDEDIEGDDELMFSIALKRELRSTIYCKILDSTTMIYNNGALCVIGNVGDTVGYWQIEVTFALMESLLENIGVSITGESVNNTSKRYGELIGAALKQEELSFSLQEDRTCDVEMPFKIGSTSLMGSINVYCSTYTIYSSSS